MGNPVGPGSTLKSGGPALIFTAGRTLIVNEEWLTPSRVAGAGLGTAATIADVRAEAICVGRASAETDER